MPGNGFLITFHLNQKMDVEALFLIKSDQNPRKFLFLIQKYVLRVFFV